MKFVDPSPPVDPEELVKNNYQAVYRTLRRLCRSQEDAEDLTQKALVSAVRSLGGFKSNCSIRTWVMAIAIRTFKNEVRKKRPLSIPGKSFQAESESDWLGEVIARLPAPQREAFLLYEVEGFTVAEIGHIASVPSGTVKARLHFARRRLRKLLSEADQQEKEILYETYITRL